MVARHANEFEGRSWVTTGHNLDFIFRRDGVAYGVEVKNTLGYMDVVVEEVTRLRETEK